MGSWVPYRTDNRASRPIVRMAMARHPDVGAGRSDESLAARSGRRGAAPAVRAAPLGGALGSHRGEAVGERDLEPLGLALLVVEVGQRRARDAGADRPLDGAEIPLLTRRD